MVGALRSWTKNPGFVLCIVICSIIFWLPHNPMRWRNQELFAFIGISILISWVMARRFSWILGLNIAWLLINGFLYFKNPHFYFGIFADLAQVMFPSVVAEAIFWCLSACFLAYWISTNDKLKQNLLAATEYFLVIDILVMIGRRIFDQEFHRYLGALDNEALDGVFLILLYTLSLIRLRRPYWEHILFGIFIFLTESTTAILALGLVWSVWFLIEARFKKLTKILGSLSAIGLIMTLGYFYVGQHDFWNTNGRVHMWKLSLSYWWQQGNHLLGSGPGSFALYAPGLSLQGHKPGAIQTIFIWAHNDYVQVLFQSGIIGLILFVALHLEILYKSYKSKLIWLFLSVLAFGFIESTQMLAEHAPTSLIGILIVAIVLGKNERKEPTVN